MCYNKYESNARHSEKDYDAYKYLLFRVPIKYNNNIVLNACGVYRLL